MAKYATSKKKMARVTSEKDETRQFFEGDLEPDVFGECAKH